MSLTILRTSYLTNYTSGLRTFSCHIFKLPFLFVFLFVSSIGHREVAVLLCSVFQTYDWMVAFLSLLLQLDHPAGLVNWNPHFVVQK